jgi:hypothetical protein
MKTLWSALALACLLVAQEPVDNATFGKIRSEELEHSQILHTLHMLADRYGPRLTGSPNFDAAAQWAVGQLTAWGLKNAHLEAWDFGHPGWLNERAAGYMVAPVHENLKFEVLAWTPSTAGAVTASAIELTPPLGPPAPPPENAGAGRGGFPGLRGPRFLGPTSEELTQWLEANQDKVRGKIVLLGKAAVVGVNFEPMPLRRDDAQIKAQFDPANPDAGRGRGFSRPPQDPNRLTAAQVAERVDPWLAANGALARVNDAGLDHGLIRAFQNRTYDVAKAVPTVVLRNEDYGRIERLLGDGEDVKLEFDIVNRIYPEGATTYNVVAEIPGSDKANEVVMLGGHLDSWHAATGATDNGIGASMMLEAVRLIEVLGLKPRRTIRVALWSGEEEGLLGSAAYVKQHFGTFEDPKPEFATFDGYFNIDSGTGRVRGASIFGPPEAAVPLRTALAPFAEWGVAGAIATASRATGGTDSTSFSAAGLPGIGLQQDPIEYGSFTWHTNLDTYERIVPDDAMKAAAEIAAAVWYVATSGEMLPRFAKDKMPAPPKPGE